MLIDYHGLTEALNNEIEDYNDAIERASGVRDSRQADRKAQNWQTKVNVLLDVKRMIELHTI